MQVQERVTIVATNKEQSYTLDIRQRSTVGGVANENLVKATIQKKCVRYNTTGFVYELTVTERTQSNLEEFRAIENDLAFLQKKIVVQTNLQGLPVSILNLGDIRYMWKYYQKIVKKTHKTTVNIDTIIEETSTLLNNNKLFTENFINSEIGTLFFPPIYNILGAKGDVCKQEKEFNGFFGAVGLPLRLTTTLKEFSRTKEKAQILRQGEINENLFDHYTVRKQFRKLADNLQLAVPVTTKYIETYDLHTYYGIQHAGQLLYVEIPALFSYEQIARITPIKQEA